MRLPICPYCGKQLDYKASVQILNNREKQHECRRCKKLSAVKYKAACAKSALIIGAVTIALNTLMLFKAVGVTLLPNLVVTIIAIVLYMVLMPLHVKLFELEGQKEPEPKLKKNRHRHKKVKLQDVEFDKEPLKGTSFDE